MDLLITGANGFLGAQVATQWLARDPSARVGCLVRGADEAAARGRLEAALRGAVRDQAMAADAGALLSRADVVLGDMDDPAWIGRARGWLRGPAAVFHCAANLSFREADRAAVRRTNVEGTRALVAALPSLPGVAAFNHVSTAYVAGDREGLVAEDDVTRPARFNNPYEESKWEAEALVRAGCARAGVAWRVFRPSIVIAHSRTHRMAGQSGFYQVADALLRFGRSAQAKGAGRILLPVPAGATLDLIPVDAVVDEMLALAAGGEATANRTFHVTAAEPLALADVLRELSPMSGVPLGVTEPGAGGAKAVLAELVMRRLRDYMPYLSYARRFERSAAPEGGFRLDVAGLQGFVRSFVAQQGKA
ncbi:MAG: SDR family oxidoreductase [Janthinobacterium lividum]